MGQPVISILILLWADLVWVLRSEWIYNDQYSYGWLALCLLIYLVYVRVSNRPVAAPSRFNVSIVVLLGIAVLAVNRIVLEANPVWRSAIWLHALTVFGTTGVLIWKMGGWSWVRHFMPAFALILFAVPWPTAIENPVTGGLMQMVSGVVVEGMNFCGFYAEQSGNLIRLRNGWVGIEAACSGVRNFQSTLMSAWFVGELFRFTFTGRALLLALSGLASLTINIGRTGILTWTTYQSGSTLTETLHDPVGHVVSGIAFVILLIVAFFLRKSFTRPEVAVEPEAVNGMQVGVFSATVLSSKVFLSALTVLLGSYLFAELWYYRIERSLLEPRALAIDWNQAPASVEFVEISPAIRGQLKYTDGRQAEWTDVRGRGEWQVFEFSWTKGSVSPFLGVHNPGTCMPASGFKNVGSHPPLIFTKGDQSIRFEVNTFRFLERPYQVYYATWSDFQNVSIPSVATTEDRLRLAWNGLRVKNRRSLQIVIDGVETEQVTRQMVREFLQGALNWEDAIVAARE